MEKALIILTTLLLISCDKYEKDAIIRKDYLGNTYYNLRIFENYTFFNNGAIKIYELEYEQINEKNIDSVNAEVDKFIELLNKKL
jgi:hypothetical protein